MAGTGGQREHLAVGSCSHGNRIILSLVLSRPLLQVVSLVMVHLIFPTAVTLGLVTSLMDQMWRVKL